MKVAIYVKAGSARVHVGGSYDSRLIVSVTAKAVDGAANEAVIAAMAKALKIPKKAIRIKSGHAAKQKLLEIDGEFDDAITNLRSED